jgi:hypothetical protein
VTVLCVLSRSCPLSGRKLPEPRDKHFSILRVPLQRGFEVHSKKHVIRLVATGVVRCYNRRFMSENVLKALDVHLIDAREVASMFMSRPFTRRRTFLAQMKRHFSHQRNDNGRCTLELIDEWSYQIHFPMWSR